MSVGLVLQYARQAEVMRKKEHLRGLFVGLASVGPTRDRGTESGGKKERTKDAKSIRSYKMIMREIRRRRDRRKNKTYISR